MSEVCAMLCSADRKAVKAKSQPPVAPLHALPMATVELSPPAEAPAALHTQCPEESNEK